MLGNYVLAAIISFSIFYFRLYDFIVFEEFYGERYGREWVFAILILALFLCGAIYSSIKSWKIYRKNRKCKKEQDR